jgi:hypothetical protein
MFFISYCLQYYVLSIGCLYLDLFLFLDLFLCLDLFLGLDLYLLRSCLLH